MLKYLTQVELCSRVMDLICIEGCGPSVTIEVKPGRIYSDKLPTWIGFEVLPREDSWVDVELEQMSMINLINVLAHINNVAPFQIEVRMPVHGCVQVGDSWYKIAA